MEENELDKSETASPFKLKRAREKGTVARGIDLGFFTALAAFVSYAWLSGSESAVGIARLAAITFRNASGADDAQYAMLAQMAAMLSGVVSPMLVFTGTIFAVTLLIEFLQVGPVFSVQPLKPDFKRINPAQGFKRLFSWRMMVESFKSVIKLGIYGAIAWLVVDTSLEQDVVAATDGVRLTSMLAGTGFKLLFFFAIAALFIAGLDQIWSRREFAKKMRMSRRELKREHRDREGDPRFKQKRRAFHDEFMKMAKSLRGARDADVILTNPTHYAIALRYRPDEMEAPMIVSRGSGSLAERIRKIGFTYGVPTVQEARLTRSLFRTGMLDAEIPDSLYQDVAEIYRKRDLIGRKRGWRNN